MKKLLIALTAVAGLVGLAKAVPTPMAAGFEDSTWKNSNWVVPSDDSSELKDWDGQQPKDVVYPGTFTSFGDKYLGVSNAKPLLAAFDDLEGNPAMPVYTDIDNGLYVDTYVKFSATETAPTPSNGVDKVIVWMYGSDTDSTTNLIVTAGYRTGTNVTPTNYVVNCEIEPDSWHRLTIKANKVGQGETAFRVYIDGQEVTISGKLVNGVCNDESAVGDDDYANLVTNFVAGIKLTANQLFPSLVTTGDNVTSLSCVGLEGWGAVDDFVLTTTDPIPDSASFATLALTWNEGIETVSYKIIDDMDGFLPVPNDGKIPGLNPSTEVEISYTLKEGYMFSGVTATGECSAEGLVFTINSALEVGLALGELVANEVVATIGSTPYASLADAIAAAGTSATTIELAKNISATNDGGLLWDAAKIRIGSDSVNQNITIDLAGKTIAVSDVAGADVAALFVIAQGSTLTIIDSSDPSVGAVTSATAKIAENSGTLNISGGRFTGLIVNNVLASEPTIALTGGSFSGEEGSFYLASVLEGTQYEANYAEGYWTVAEKLPSDFIVRAAPVENTTLEVTVEGEPVTAGENNTYTIPAGATATVTYTAAKHYTITANGVQEFTAAGTAVAPTLHAWLKYAADLYLCGSTTTNKLEVQAQLGTDDHYYDIGTQVAAQYAGVMTDPEFISEKGTYYISKIVDLESETFVEFTYDGTTYAKVDGALEVTLGAGNVLSYTVTTGTKATFAQVYFTKYEPPAPVGPSIGDDTYTDEVTFTNTVKAGATIVLPQDWSFEGRTIKDGQGNVWATLPAYYTISGDGKVSLDPKVTPTISDGDDGHKAIEIGTSGVSINVAEPWEGLWYVLMRAETVGGTYEPVDWVQATGTTENIQLEDDTKLEDGKIPGKGFYKVKVTDVEPTIPEVE